ncbi:hypothetical protein [Chondromyces crocatus]|nr:hypothetical protein [Chondromyces crocatus]
MGSSSSGVDPTPMVGAAGVSVREVALSQGVKRPLMQNGVASSSTIPIVFGRDAVLRVFYDVDANYNGGPITARLHLDGVTTLEVVTDRLFPTSIEPNLSSTINFNLTADLVLGAISYRVELLQRPSESPLDNPAAKYPTAGFDTVPVAATPALLRIDIVPISYGADGSNRVPDLSPAQLRRYQDYFYAMYPATSVDVVAQQPMAWNLAIGANGSGWDQVLDALASYRTQQGPDPNTYYYGVFMPSPTKDQFCGGGCVAGLGFVAAPQDSYARAAIGLGYPEDNMDTETAVHEIGHTHGRNHSPCGGAGGPDPSFPYSDGGIGSWGYNILTRQLYDPTVFTDLMGYCVPIWISDYTFRGLFQRMQQLGSASVVFPPEVLDRTYDRVRVSPDGVATFLDPVTLHRPPMAETIQVDVQTASGTQRVAAQLYRYNHLEGGQVLWPRTQEQATSAVIEFDGKAIPAQR